MKLNLMVRIKNKSFWVTLIPTLILLIQEVLKLFGIHVDLGELGNNILSIVEAVFLILAIVGIVADPTTPGVSDSDRAMTYIKPGKSGDET